MREEEGTFIYTTSACTIIMAMSYELVSMHLSLLSQTLPAIISYFVGPNELSIRDASLVHAVLGQGGLPKGPRNFNEGTVIAAMSLLMSDH